MDRRPDFRDLVSLMDRLREPGGCPWDRQQSYATLRGFLLEECYEVADAIDRGERVALREELGDLLFQVVFLARLAKEEGAFTIEDVVASISDKMVRRHPHVFGDARVRDADDALRQWEEIKRGEREGASEAGHPGEASVFSGIPRSLPALLKAQRIGDKAARVGFDWPDAAQIFEKAREELSELERASASGDGRAAREELGDVLFSIVMLARRLGLDPEEALERTNRKFQMRFDRVQAELRRRGIPLEEAGCAMLDRLWDEAKAAEAAPGGSGPAGRTAEEDSSP